MAHYTGLTTVIIPAFNESKKINSYLSLCMLNRERKQAESYRGKNTSGSSKEKSGHSNNEKQKETANTKAGISVHFNSK